RDLLLDRRLDRPGAAAQTVEYRSQHLPGRNSLLHAIQGDAVRAPDARRRVRPLLQQEAVPEGRDQVSAEDHGRADGGREEADPARLEWQDQDRRLRSTTRLLRKRAGAVHHLVRREDVGLEQSFDDRYGSGL